MLAAAVSGGAVGGCERTTRDTDIKTISAGQAKALWDKAQKGGTAAVFLDPRPAKAFNESHITGAQNLTLPRIDLRGPRDRTLESYDTIVVYGENPGSAVAKGMTKRLLAVGYDGIRWYAGGISEWRSRGYPVTEGPKAEAPKVEAPKTEPAAETPAKPEPEKAQDPK